MVGKIKEGHTTGAHIRLKSLKELKEAGVNQVWVVTKFTGDTFHNGELFDPEEEARESERLYGEKGFTDEVLEKLGEPDRDLGRLSYYDFIKPEELEEVAELIPEENLKDKQNKSPTFKKFLEFGQENEDVRFSIYVVPKSRTDERVTVTTIFIPKEKGELIRELRKWSPDEDHETEVEGKVYQRLWWD